MRVVPKQGVWTRSSSTNTILTIEQIKEHCYIGIDEDDALLADMEKACRVICEKELGRPLLTTSVDLWYSFADICQLLAGRRNQQNTSLLLGNYHSAYPILYLPLGRLQEVTSISLYADDGTEEEVDVEVYQASITGEQGAVFIKSPLVNGSFRPLDTMKISVVAGYGDTTDSVPESIKRGMLATIGYWYEHRGDDNADMGYIPPAAKSIWSVHRIERFK
jgi:uncharacterized phiE125 gp8 family phage protein